MLDHKKILSKTEKLRQVTAESWIKGVGILIVLAVAAFAEVAFLGIISKMFPSNFLFQLACIVGGVATGTSAVVLIFAKLRWIRAGHQEFVSWAFLGIEIVIMVMNLILSFQLAEKGVTSLDQWIQVYYNFVPATPIFALVGWILLFMTDRSKEIFDTRRDMQDEMQDTELAHENEQHKVLMGLKKDILHIQSQKIRQQVEIYIPEIERITAEIVAKEVGELVGMYIPRSSGNTTPLLPSGPIVTGSLLPAPAAPGAQQPKLPNTEPLQNPPDPVPVAPGAPRRRYKHFHKHVSEQRIPPTPPEPPAAEPVPAAKKKLTPKTRQAEKTPS